MKVARMGSDMKDHEITPPTTEKDYTPPILGMDQGVMADFKEGKTVFSEKTMKICGESALMKLRNMGFML